MKRCGKCGSVNWDRPSLEEDWRCTDCDSILVAKQKGLGQSGGDGNKVTPPKKVDYDDSEYF